MNSNHFERIDNCSSSDIHKPDVLGNFSILPYFFDEKDILKIKERSRANILLFDFGRARVVYHAIFHLVCDNLKLVLNT
jgi:hypothetical protein